MRNLTNFRFDRIFSRNNKRYPTRQIMVTVLAFALLTTGASASSWTHHDLLAPHSHDRYTIQVRFTNNSGYSVAFFLTGINGGGSEYRLGPGQTASYFMDRTHDSSPAVIVHQADGSDQSFPVDDHGRYLFVLDENNKIVTTTDG